MENHETSNSEEMMAKFGMIEQQIRQIHQQLEIIERNIIEMNSLSIGLDELKGSVGKEMFSPIGKGIFVKAKIISDELNVDIGNGNFIKKSIDDTKELIGEQIKKLEKAQDELNNALQAINEEITRSIIKSQKNSKD